MKREMLINVLQPEECRIAVLEDGQLEELYMERKSVEAFAGNIYRGKIVNLEPSIQAAFVDFGVGRNGFLHISDVEPQYFRQGGYDPEEIMRESDEMAEAAAKESQRIRAWQQACVQGRTPQSEASYPRDFQTRRRSSRSSHQRRHRYQRPHSQHLPVDTRSLSCSDAITVTNWCQQKNRGRRRSKERLKRCLLSLNPPKGVGFIVRTAGAGRKEKELQRDMDYLLRLWKAIVRRVKTSNQPGVIYEESDLIIRTIRDIFSDDIDQILIDEPEVIRKGETSSKW